MLTDAKIRKARAQDKAYKMRDGNGLYLEIRSTGSKIWRYRYKIQGKEGIYTIGRYPEIPLAEARNERDSARALVKQGVNPTEHRDQCLRDKEAENLNTFKLVAEEYTEKHIIGLSKSHQNKWHRVMNTDVYPEIGGLPIRNIKPIQILNLMRKIESRGAPTIAKDARVFCSQVFRYGVITLRCDIDPAQTVQGAIKLPKKKGNPGLNKSMIGKLLNDLDEGGLRPTTKIAIKLLLMLFVRTKELRNAEWDEFDMSSRVWKIPAEKMKKNKDFLIPLSDQAIDLLQELHLYTGGGRWLFPNKLDSRRCMSESTVNRALSHIGWGGIISGHKFRNTASTLLHEAGFETLVIERQLAHVDSNKTRASYNHAEFLADRRKMMQTWSDFILESGGKFCMLNNPFVNL